MIYFILSLLPMSLYVIVKTNKSIHMLQQNRYNDNQWYLKWIMKNKKKVFLSLDLTYLLLFLLGFILKGSYLELAALVWGIVILANYLLLHTKETVKKPLVFTKRVKRLLLTFYLMHILIITIMCIHFKVEMLSIYYLIIGLLIYLNHFVVYLVNIINKPIEKAYAIHYKNSAIRKLNDMKHMEVIGITGSYGKTSSKNILNDILNIKYNAFPTPKNFNTELGLINTINNYLDKFSDYFIAEMGALRIEHIQEYCDLVHPKYGILTIIGTAHLETFGSRENIQKGKFALIESLPSDGIGVLNGDDPWQVNYKLENNCKIIWVGIDNKKADVVADNIKCTKDGMTFDVKFKGDKNSYEFKTTLLGKANIYNFLQAIALGKELGISIQELQRAVLKVRPVEHRLELKKQGNLTIIDDAYNSNPTGSKMALEVLDMMNGKKIIITPGMVELGEKQYELNKELGSNIAPVCDEVILVGDKQTKPIQDGLKSKKYPEKQIHVVDTIGEAFQILPTLQGSDTYVLLENDLPDTF